MGTIQKDEHGPSARTRCTNQEAFIEAAFLDSGLALPLTGLWAGGPSPPNFVPEALLLETSHLTFDSAAGLAILHLFAARFFWGATRGSQWASRPAGKRN